MQFFNQVLQLIQTGIAAIINIIRMLLNFLFQQFQSIPWGNFGGLPIWKQVVLVGAIIFAIYYLFRVVKDLLKASEGFLSAFVTVLGAFIKALVPTLIVAFVLAGVIWGVNKVNIPWLP